MNLSKYVTSLLDLHIPYEFRKKNKKELVYLFYNLEKLFGLDLKKLSKTGRSYLFASLVEFLSYEDAKRVKGSGKLDYSLIPNQTAMYHIFYNLKSIPEEAFNSPKLDSYLKLLYLTRVERSLKKAKAVFFRALKEKKDLNSFPLYLSSFDEVDILKFYNGIGNFEPEKNNYLNYTFYGLLLYKNGKYDRINDIKSALYQMNMLDDEDSIAIVNYILFAVKRRKKPLDTATVQRWMLRIRKETNIATR